MLAGLIVRGASERMNGRRRPFAHGLYPVRCGGAPRVGTGAHDHEYGGGSWPMAVYALLARWDRLCDDWADEGGMRTASRGS